MGPDKQIWRKFKEAVDVMVPDKMIAGGGSGCMGGAGDQAETDCVYERPTAHHRNDIALRTLFAIYTRN